MSDLKKHILIIEDEPDIAELLEYNLKTAGYRTTKANNGEIGLENMDFHLTKHNRNKR